MLRGSLSQGNCARRRLGGRSLIQGLLCLVLVTATARLGLANQGTAFLTFSISSGQTVTVADVPSGYCCLTFVTSQPFLRTVRITVTNSSGTVVTSGTEFLTGNRPDTISLCKYMPAEGAPYTMVFTGGKGGSATVTIESCGP